MLNLEHVSKTFNKGNAFEKKALDDVSLKVEDGDFISIIGANGAGKSTLFNAICGSFLTDSGRIVLNGEDITFLPSHERSKRIGRLFQDPMKGTAPGMSIEENLYLSSGKGGWLSRITRREREDFRERLSLLGMGLEDRMDSPVGLLSGGQRQALTLLMGTINPPSILLLDEHTAALDPQSAEKIMKITDDIIRKNRITCLMITHNMQTALDYGNRTIMMNRGRIIYDTTSPERDSLSVNDLMEKFREASGNSLNTDRILLNEN